MGKREIICCGFGFVGVIIGIAILSAYIHQRKENYSNKYFKGECNVSNSTIYTIQKYCEYNSGCHYDYVLECKFQGINPEISHIINFKNVSKKSNYNDIIKKQENICKYGNIYDCKVNIPIEKILLKDKMAINAADLIGLIILSIAGFCWLIFLCQLLYESREHIHPENIMNVVEA